jgi:hypothetical protein
MQDKWIVIQLDEFGAWLDQQPGDLRDEAFARFVMLEALGPTLGRPTVDTLKSSKLSNMKEIRFDYHRDPVRILFAFDYKRQAVIILGGIKSVNKRWYDDHIPIAERLFNQHVEREKKKDEISRAQQQQNLKGKGQDERK